MDLDFEVAKAVSAVRLLERALHDTTSRWEMRWAGITSPVERTADSDGVTLTSSFTPGVCFLVEPDPLVELLVDGRPVSLHWLDRHPGDGEFTLLWRLKVSVVGAHV